MVEARRAASMEVQTSLNDLALDENVSEFKSLKLWRTVATKPQ